VLTRGDRDLPERQRSLRAAIDWTYALLADAQRSLFERIGVCSGPVPLSTVEAIADPAEEETALDRLDALLECGLVRQRRDARLGVRFFMPQALRDYALERLADSGHEQSVRRQYAEHVAAVAHAARLWKWGAAPDQQTDLLAVSDEIRPAVAWTRENARELHVRLCAALAPYWVYRGALADVSEELRQAFDSGIGSIAERAWISTFLAKMPPT
jgi:predicted ATPase